MKQVFIFENGKVITEFKTDDILEIINFLETNYKVDGIEMCGKLEVYGYYLSDHWKIVKINGILIRNYKYKIRVPKYPYADYSKEIKNFLKLYRRNKKLEKVLN